MTNFELGIGTSFEEYIQWLSPTGEVISLADWSANMDVRLGPGEPIVVSLSTATGEITHVDDALRLFLPFSDTLNLPEGSYYYDLLITRGDSRPKLLKGSFAIRPTITVVP